MSALPTQPESTPDKATQLRILAGPFEAFGPLRIREHHFSTTINGVQVLPLSVGWLPREVGRPFHADLARNADDRRVHVAATAISTDYSDSTQPLLVLPGLSRELIGGAGPAPGRMSIVDMLHQLVDELGGVTLDIGMLALDGLEGGSDRLMADVTWINARLERRGLSVTSGFVERVGRNHPAFWRAALNFLTWSGPQATALATALIAQLSDEELAAAAADHDGHQVLELAPPDRLVIPPNSPSVLSVAAAIPPGDRSSPDGARTEIGLNGRKVTFVCEKLADRSGGAERVLIELANALCRRGYQVEILSHELRGKPPFFLLEFGVVHTNLSPLPGVQTRGQRLVHRVRTKLQAQGPDRYPIDRITWNLRYAAFQRRLAAYIDATRPDVVVPFMPPAITATALARTLHRPRLVASMHNAPEQDFENPVRWDPGDYARRRRLELMDRMDTIAVLLPQYQEWYPDHLRPRTTVAPNAVEPVPADALDSSVRNKTILAVGRLADTKRHDLSLRAFAELSADYPEWQLKIFGIGPLSDDLVALHDDLGLGDRARLLGHTSTIDVEYLSASILCHPARFEGFPLAVTESLASGLPVVGFADCSGLNSLVVNGDNGLLVDPGDGSDDARLAGLVEALRHLMDDEAARATLSKGGPVSMEPYEPERVVDIWEQMLFPE